MEPLGITHLEFAKSGNHYTWRKVKTVVHNIVIGKLWIDQVSRREGWKVERKFQIFFPSTRAQ